jgi:hypothetical protein
VSSYTSRLFHKLRELGLVRTFRRVAFVFGSICSAFALHAQSSPTVLPVPPGARVRVTAPSLVAPLIANYLEMRGDTVVLVDDRAGRGLWSIPYNDIRSLHLSIGQKNNHGPYIARGAVLGGAAGFIVGVIFAATVDPSDTTKKFKRVTTGAIGGVGGALIGGLVGSRFITENWSPIVLRRRVTLTPMPRGAQLRVELPF